MKFSKDIVEKVIRENATKENAEQVVHDVITEEDLAMKILRQIQSAQNKADDEKAAEQEDKPKVKLVNFVMLPPENDETAWILRIPENLAPGAVEEKVRLAIDQYNTTRRGRKHPVNLIGESFEVVPAKIWKEYNIKVVTKLPCTALPMHQREHSAVESSSEKNLAA